jgi:hypothetical protein
MKKFIIMSLVLLLVSVSGVALAANPFTDVPANHWAYQAIAGLAKAGIVDGYGDGTFRGDKLITRYEMAEIVAKAMANEDKANPQQKAEIDKLAAEFRTELDNLGVRVSALESKVGNIQLSGSTYVRYQTLDDNKVAENKFHSLYSHLEFDATAKINADWTAGISWETWRDFYKDSGKAKVSANTAWGHDPKNPYPGSFDVTTAYVKGPVAGTTMTAGKFENLFGTGLIFDDNMTGATFEFGNKLKTKLAYGEVDSNVSAYGIGPYLSKFAKAYSADLNYDVSKATNVSFSHQNWSAKDDAVRDMKVNEIGFTSTLNDTIQLYGAYDKTNADSDNKAYVIGFNYKKADHNIPGSFGGFLDYENYQENTAIDTTYWASPGSKCYALGLKYVPAKDILWSNTFVYIKMLPNNLLGANESTESTDATQKFYRTQVTFYF